MNFLTTKKFCCNLPPNIDQHPSTSILKNDLTEMEPTPFGILHGNRIRTSYKPVDGRYGAVWLKIMNTCKIHVPNKILNHYESFIRPSCGEQWIWSLLQQRYLRFRRHQTICSHLPRTDQVQMLRSHTKAYDFERSSTLLKRSFSMLLVTKVAHSKNAV